MRGTRCGTQDQARLEAVETATREARPAGTVGPAWEDGLGLAASSGSFTYPCCDRPWDGGITWQQGRLAEQQAQDDAIQAYLDQMSTLMIDKDLRNTETKSEERLLARARTVTVLSRLVARSHDRETNKEQVVEFLIEAELVHRKHGKIPVISLEETDLSGGVDLDREDLHSANLADANLQDADLAGADLRSANLEEANLRNTNLEDAKLKEALLCRADLQGAEGVTKEQLEEQAKSLKGATMPDGQKYEDNSKDKPCD
jgi:Pentapeptide repeats (8 copies)